MSELKHTPEPCGYAIFRDGKFLATEKSHAVALHWIDAEIVPLVPMKERDDLAARVAELESDAETYAKKDQANYAMAETIRAIAGLCTYEHESKGDFIGRVRAVLGDDPDLRVSELRKQRDELLSALDRIWNEYIEADPHIPTTGLTGVLAYMAKDAIAGVKGGSSC